MASGFILKGIPVGTAKFQGVSHLDELQAFGLKRPTELVSMTKKDSTRDDLRIKELREAIQRGWDVARKKRAALYAEYIRKVESDDQIGGTPALTIWIETQCPLNDDGSLIIPYTHAPLFAVDGETQLEARFILRDDWGLAETGEKPLGVTIYHGVGPEFANQILHDYNRYAHPIPESKLGVFSHSGALSRAIHAAMKHAAVEMDDINRLGSKPRKGQIISYVQLLHGGAGIAMGEVEGLRRQASSYLDELNSPVRPPFGSDVIKRLMVMITEAKEKESARKAPSMVWQVAGVKSGNGSLDWAAGVRAYNDTMKAGRGGPRMPVSARLQAIHQAM